MSLYTVLLSQSFDDAKERHHTMHIMQVRLLNDTLSCEMVGILEVLNPIRELCMYF